MARKFEDVILKILPIIPEDDILKNQLIKILEKFPYKAPELKYGWNETHYCLIDRFDNKMPEWGPKVLSIWTNKEEKEEKKDKE
jgi:hypothetical protein